MSTPLIFDHEPGSMTPAEVVERSRRDLEPSRPLTEFILALVERLEGESRERIIRLHRRGVRLQKMYEGDYGDFHPTSGAWMSRPGYAMGTPNQRTGKSSPWYPHNKIRRYFDANTAQTLQSRFDLRAIATSDSDRSELAASAARPIVDYYERKIATEDWVSDWDKQKRFFGQVFFEIYWDVNEGPEVDELGVTYEDLAPGMSILTCVRCAQSGVPEQFNQGCPQCGSDATIQEDVPAMQMPTIGVTGKKRAGDACVDAVPSLQVNYDRTAPTFETGLWCERQFRMRIEKIQQLFPWYKVPRGDTMGSYDRSGVDLLEDSIGNAGNWAQRYRKPPSAFRGLVRKLWLQPPLLFDWIAPQDIPFAGGDKIPKGTRGSEKYEKGMYVLLCGKDVLDVWGDDFTDHWVQLKHKHIPNRTDGDGGEDIIRPAQEYNEARSFAVAAWKHNAARPQWVRDPIKEGDFTGQPGYIGHVTGLKYEIPLSNLHHVADPVPFDQTVLAMLEGADAEMQQSESAFSSVTGDPDVQQQGGGKTARGLELITGNAQTMRAPELALAAHAYRQIFLKILKLFKENATEQRWIPFDGTAGDIAGDFFKGSDLEGDIDLLFGRGSYLPKDSQRRRANLMWALSIPGPSGLPMVLDQSAPAKWRQYILEVGEVDLELEGFTRDVREARRRIEEMKRLSQQATQFAGMVGQIAQTMPPQIDPNTGMPQEPPSAAQILCQMVPLDPMVDNHAIHHAFLQNWCKGDESRKVDPAVNEAVHQRLQEHQQAGAQQAAQQQMLGMIANGPMMQMQQAQQQQQQGAQAGQAEEDRAHQSVQEDKRMAHEKEIVNMKAKQTKAARR